MISEQIIKFDLQILWIVRCDMKVLSIVHLWDPSYECTASDTSPDLGSGA
ncbi:hypothetical protein SLEP1_g55925 [Rubroshorea leprosula]|uniref:Uncharacterized protein n=1 Tax=Rubroshorea leprosula TaxID=152421 RepID=A0AAV5MHZ8_9ROSI|nr:hypothetical protein SLEP1_g55925 [Rubroshorea leprosula]